MFTVHGTGKLHDPGEGSVERSGRRSDHAKTVDRSVVGTMNEFAFLAEVYRDQRGADDLIAIATYLAGVPCGALRKSHRFPDLALRALVAEHVGD